MRLPWAAGRDRTGKDRTGQDSTAQVSHPSRQFAAALALRSQGVAVDHHPLDLELAKEKRSC